MKILSTKFSAFIISFFLCSLGLAQSNSASRWYEEHRDRPQMLRQFLQQMPKGADLHSHLSGAVYAETYLDLASKADACIDIELYKIYPSPCQPNGVAVKDVSRKFREDAIDHLSVRNLALSNQSGRNRFFETFALLGGISAQPESQPIMIAEVANRAASQNILLLELMISIQSKAVLALGGQRKIDASSDLALERKFLMENGLPELVLMGQKDLDQMFEAYKKHMHCSTVNAEPGCGVKLRFLIQTSRNSLPAQVYAQLVYAFELAKVDPRIGGINLVSPEDNAIALRDYGFQMEMIRYLSSVSPQVKKALHAGELVFGSVPPENLANHISKAVSIAKADRIGHGVDIAYEKDAIETMKMMKDRGIPVEICLTSNELILNVKGKNHPLRDYLKLGVPIILASDDEGVSRIDLTNEYVLAATDQGLSYEQLKQISRNSLTWSFLRGESLWQNPVSNVKVLACRGDQPNSRKITTACQSFLSANEKANLQWELEARLQKFEQLPHWKTR